MPAQEWIRGLIVSVPFLFSTVSMSAHGASVDETALDETSAGADAVLEVMSKPGRLAADLQRDLRSKPQFVIPLLNLQSGNRVVDIFGSGGYYSELLAGAVGDEGEVLLHNNEGFEAWGINELHDRFDDRDAGPITRYVASGINLDLTENSLDGAIIVMAFHDLYVIPKVYDGTAYVRAGNPANVTYFLEQVYRALKPGGRFVVVDHAADPAADQETAGDLHRIVEAFARQEIESRGFHFVASTDALRNAADDRNRIVFDEDLQGRTDLFVLAFEKPRN